MPQHPIPGPRDTSRQGAVLNLADLSYTKLDELDRSRAVVIFSASPLEEHGPHLPVATDLYISEFFAARAAKRIQDSMPDWTALLGPPLPIGASAFEHAGTLLVGPRTLRNAALDYGAALARQGFRYILLFNAHAGPLHVVALEEAAAIVSRRYDARMLSVSGPIVWKVLRGGFTERLKISLGREFNEAEQEALRGDAHGGLWETSLMLLIRPDLVDPSFTRLAPERFTILESLRKNYPLRLGRRQGYIGSPATATREFGEAAARALDEVVWEVVKPVFEAEANGWQQTSMLYKIPFMRTGFPYIAGAACLALFIILILRYWI